MTICTATTPKKLTNVNGPNWLDVLLLELSGGKLRSASADLLID
jgi:hypothetical protein